MKYYGREGKKQSVRVQPAFVAEAVTMQWRHVERDAHRLLSC